jgi:hypothetical protein
MSSLSSPNKTRNPNHRHHWPQKTKNNNKNKKQTKKHKKNNNATQKTKEMSNTDPTKNRGYVNTDNKMYQLIKRLFMDAKRHFQQYFEQIYQVWDVCLL